MNLTDLIIFILASIGLTNIIVNSNIFKPVREWMELQSEALGELFGCVTCVGFWVGLFLPMFYFDMPCLIGGAISSISNYVFVVVIDYLMAKAYLENHVHEEGEEDDDEK